MGYGNIEVRLWIWTRKRRGLWVMHSRACGMLLLPMVPVRSLKRWPQSLHS